MNSSHYCLLTGRHTTLAELTRRKAKRRASPDRPPLPKAPTARQRVTAAEVRDLRAAVKRALGILDWDGRGRGNLAKGCGAAWARTLGVPYCDMQLLFCTYGQRPGRKAMQRIASALSAYTRPTPGT